MAEPCVLVVEDDDDIRGFVSWALQIEKNAVAEAANGREALKVLEERTVDLILLDMVMPVMDGWEFARNYRARPGEHAPIIVMTAATDAMSRAEQVHATAALSKPFELPLLLQIVAKCLRPWRAAEELCQRTRDLLFSLPVDHQMSVADELVRSVERWEEWLRAGGLVTGC
jgi:two-component system, chemotaxis family, chemotaxis protein CheY